MWRSRGFKEGVLSIAGAPVAVEGYIITTPDLTPAQVEHLTRSSAWTLLAEAPAAPALSPLEEAEAPAAPATLEGEQSPTPAPAKRRGRPRKG